MFNLVVVFLHSIKNFIAKLYVTQFMHNEYSVLSRFMKSIET